MYFKYGIDQLSVEKAISLANGETKGILTQQAINNINK